MARQPYKRWTEQEVQYLTENYGHMTAQEIANILGCTRIQAQTKIKNLKLSKVRQRDWSNKDDIKLVQIVCDNFTNMAEGFRIAGTKMKRTPNKCMSHWYYLKHSNRLQEIISELHYEAVFMAMNKDMVVYNTKNCANNSVQVKHHSLWSKIKKLFKLS